MQRTIRVLRLALPLAFIGFVVLIFFSWDRTAGGKRRGTGEGVTSTQRPEDIAQAEAKSFEDVQTIGGRVVSRIRADRVVSFESGWTTLEGVSLTLFRENGLTYELSCPQAQFNTQTKEADAKGGVQVRSSDGIEISTAEIRYDGTRLTNDIPVKFRVDRWTGRAGALDLNVQAETLKLHREVSATLTETTPGELPMTLAAAETTFRRRENMVEFRERVSMQKGAESVRADTMTGRFTQDRQRIIGLEGDGHCVIVMAARGGAGEDLGGRKEITCDGFFSELGPDGRINAINARSGARPAHAILSGPPRRDIMAATFRVALTDRVVSEIRAAGKVRMKETAETTREIQSEHVTVWFDAATRKARSAYLEGGFKYQDPKTTATAFRANYDIAGDRIILTTDPGWQATVISDGHTLRAKQIEFSPRAQTARASGSVIAQLVSKGGGATADTTNLFPAGKPVFVNADELMMRSINRVAHFTGHVRAWQDRNVLFANELQVQGAGESITARGSVRTMLYNTTAEARKTPVQSTSEQLIARKTDRRIDLTGKVTIQDETRTLKSDKASFFFDEGRKVQRIEAETSVQLVESATGRKGSGEKAIYFVDRKMIHLHGTPATITDPSGSVSGQQILFDLTRNRVQVVSPDGQTKGTYKNDG